MRLPAEAPFLRALLSRADVILETWRPGVAARLGVRPRDVPERAVYCSITGFGSGGRHERRAGHDLNYQGWAGVLDDTAPAWPPVQIADLAAGALGAVTEVLAALLARERTGRGGHIVVSMTHNTHRLASYRLAGDPLPRLLTGGLACYRTYATADGRFLTVGALETKFFARLCELLGRPELAKQQYGRSQEALAVMLAAIFASRPLDGVARRVRRRGRLRRAGRDARGGRRRLGTPAPGRAAALGEHTARGGASSLGGENLVDTSSGNVALERRFAALAGLPVGNLPRYGGSAVTWESHRFPGDTPFVVELPAGKLSPARVRRTVRAILAVAAAAAAAAK